MSNSVMMNGGDPENVVQWLEACCPNDVVPKVLAFCGPQMVNTLMGTNRYWYQLIAQTDSTWRSLCEGMYKVSPLVDTGIVLMKAKRSLI